MKKVSFLVAATLLASQLVVPVASAAAPKCNNLTATIWVDGSSISGGPDDGDSYAGTLNGTSGDDVIVGTSNDDVINGNGGNDTICAQSDDDDITTGSGNDWVDGGNGEDDMNAGSGNNTV